MLKKHAILTAIGLVVGLLVLAWVHPLTSAGATLLLLLVVVLSNAIAALPIRKLTKMFMAAVAAKSARGPAGRSARTKQTKSATTKLKANRPAASDSKANKPTARRQAAAGSSLSGSPRGSDEV